MKNIWKWLTFFWAAYPILVIIGFFLMSTISLIYYKNFISGENYIHIYNWDYPSEAIGDFNGDGLEDRITSGGCANFGPQDKRSPLMCQPYYSESSRSVNGSEAKYPKHSYAVKRNGKWFILVVDKNLKLTKYLINNDKTISVVDPDESDYMDNYIYLAPVLFTDALVLPGAYAAQFIGPKSPVLIYMVVLVFFIIKWQQPKLTSYKKNRK